MIWPWRKRRPDSEAASGPTGRIDRLIVQQHDPRQTVTIGGIDTCMRGILDYGAPPATSAGVTPPALADVIRAARHLDRTKIADAVAALSAPRVVQEVFFPPSLEATVELPTGGVR